jgi:16S rRNA (cytidine1402-2'-O)-methyltransferase
MQELRGFPIRHFVSSALDERIPVIAVPGASAFLPALVMSGFPTDRFAFEGFLPIKKGRMTLLNQLKTEERTIILYESPHRLLKTLNNLLETFGDRKISVSREITKKFEETFRSTISGAIEHFSAQQIRGEFVLVIEGNQQKD